MRLDPEPRKLRLTPRVLLAIGGLVLVAVVLFLVLKQSAQEGLALVKTPPAQATGPLALTTVPDGRERNTSIRLPAAVGKRVSGARVFDHDDLNELAPGRWYASGPTVQADRGLLTVEGSPGWASWWGTTRTFQQGDAVLLLFQFDPNTQFELHLERGQWAKPTYQRWAFHVGTRFEMSIWEGTQPVRFGEMVGKLAPQAGRWYYLFMGMDADEFVAYAWDAEQDSPYLEYRRALGEGWSGPGWIFGMGANRGHITIDSFTEIAFQSLRKPSRAGEWFWKGLTFYDQGEINLALEAFEAAIRNSRDQAPYHYYRALTLWQLDRPQEALADLNKAVELDPQNDEFHRQLAWLYGTGMKQEQQSLASIDKAVGLAPLEARNYRMRGLVLREVKGDLQAALADFDHAIELSPNEAELYRQRGQTYNELGDFASGLASARRCAELQAEDATCYLEQARSYKGLDDRASAVAAYRKFVDLEGVKLCAPCQKEAEAFIAQFGQPAP